MRKIVFAAVLCAMSAAVLAANKQPVALTAIPQAVQDSIAAHYTPDQILIVTCEKTMPKHFQYDFRIADGSKLSYSDKAVLMRLENEQGIDLSYVPSGIQKYVKETFPNATMIEYRRSSSRQDIMLNIDIRVVFDKSGRFLRLED